jgi:hypothetical protein
MEDYDHKYGQVHEQKSSRVGQLLHGRTVGLSGIVRAQRNNVGAPSDTDDLQAGQEAVHNNSALNLLTGLEDNRREIVHPVTAPIAGVP